ncbi:MAG TPA: carboxypeptidase-like regulatory domain-containing protein [Candidatus Sulfotelmatobacter sp.]|nr:carboxypeptidase-like regulatory domain-containing protein [Candidatus Sulfotelmatobacter sp.]
MKVLLFKYVLLSSISLVSLITLPLFAQQTASSADSITSLPDAPSQAGAQSTKTSSNPENSATLSGTVVDKNGDVLQGAQVTLSDPAGPARNAQSGRDGQFAFPGLPPDTYKLTVSAPGMTTFTSSNILLSAGEFHIVPPVTLEISPVTASVTVNGNSKQLSEEQVHIAEQQRIVGVIPNFYSSYDWNAPPMLAKQKYQLGLRSVFDPVSLLSVAGIAGAEQYEGIFPAYGSGFEGYSKRYGAAFANHLSGTLLARAVFPSIFHQDPRYFYKGTGSFKSRALYAVSAAVVARGDNGRWQPNYSLVLGNFSAAAISNLYYPASDRGASLVLFNGLAGLGGDAASNLIREFLLKRFTSHAPKDSGPSH